MADRFLLLLELELVVLQRGHTLQDAVELHDLALSLRRSIFNREASSFGGMPPAFADKFVKK